MYISKTINTSIIPINENNNSVNSLNTKSRVNKKIKNKKKIPNNFKDEKSNNLECLNISLCFNSSTKLLFLINLAYLFKILRFLTNFSFNLKYLKYSNEIKENIIKKM